MSIKQLDPTEARALQEGGEWSYVDVRTAAEFAAGHPVGAIHITIGEPGPGGLALNPNFVDEIKAKFGTDAKLLLGCKSGGRSMRAAQMLAEAGFTELVNVEGGFHGSPTQQGWLALGLPVES